jgi:hypothetical protein
MNRERPHKGAVCGWRAAGLAAAAAIHPEINPSLSAIFT